MTQENIKTSVQYKVHREGVVYGNIKDDVFIDKDGSIYPIVNNAFSSEKIGEVLANGVVKPKPTSTFKVDLIKKIVTRDDGTIFDLIKID